MIPILYRARLRPEPEIHGNLVEEIMPERPMDDSKEAATEKRLRKQVEDRATFLQNTRSFPARQAAIDAYADSVQQLDLFLSARHLCVIYEGSPASQLPGLAATAINRLRAKNRCLFLNSPSMATGFRCCLAAAGLDVAQELEKGGLVVSSDQSHLRGGLFDVDQMLAFLSDAIDEALNDGYRGLWATGDMMWELGSEMNFEKLLEYELRLEELMRLRPELSAICQYHRTVLPGGAIEAALHTHPAVYVNEALSRTNPFHMRPEVLYRPEHWSDDLIDEMLREPQN